jgi:phage recombination protein Bet
MSAEATQVITAAEVKQAEQERVSLLATFAHRYGMEANNMMRTLRATVLRPSSNGAEPSNEQVAAFMIVANQHELNPFTKEIHGFVDKRGGIVPIVGVDGWAKLANAHPQYDGIEFEQDDEKCTCTVYRKDRNHPTVVTEYLSECKRPSEVWTTHPKRMLRHRAMVQGYRIAFSFAGVFDPDEGEQVLAAQNGEIDVTPVIDLGAPEGTKEKRIGHAKLRDTVEKITKFTENKDGDSLMKLWREFDQEQQLYIWGFLLPWVRRSFKEIEAVARKTTGIGDLPSFSMELLKSCKNALELDEAWKRIQAAFFEADQEIPDNVATKCDEMRSSMGAV